MNGIPLPREQNRESWQSQHSQGTRGLPSVAKVTIQARSRGKDSVRLSTRHLVRRLDRKQPRPSPALPRGRSLP
jgi:hypothetical protein